MKREQIEAYFAGKEPLLVEAVSRLVAIDSVEIGRASCRERV